MNNSLLTGALTVSLAGLTLYEDVTLTEPCADFSRARSPSRVLRRWKQRGIKGHGVFERPSRSSYVAGSAIHMHPAQARALRDRLERERDAQLAESIRAYPSQGQAHTITGYRAGHIVVDDPLEESDVLTMAKLRRSLEALPPDPFRKHMKFDPS